MSDKSNLILEVKQEDVKDLINDNDFEEIQEMNIQFHQV